MSDQSNGLPWFNGKIDVFQNRIVLIVTKNNILKLDSPGSNFSIRLFILLRGVRFFVHDFQNATSGNDSVLKNGHVIHHVRHRIEEVLHIRQERIDNACLDEIIQSLHAKICQSYQLSQIEQ